MQLSGPAFRLLHCSACWLHEYAYAAKDSLVLCYEDTDIRPWQTKAGKGLSFLICCDEVSRRTNIKFSYVARPVETLPERGKD
ncbi:MAG: hypothetical protein U5M23_08600 [Marinagarivorans sp.]|nr:hypothetical protein [Marinagarivorans sp.]